FLTGSLPLELELRFVGDASHALSAAAGDGLEHDRVTDGPCALLGFLEVRGFATRHDGYASGLHDLTGAQLVSHRSDGRRGWTDEREASVGTRPSKAGVFRQKAVTRVD